MRVVVTGANSSVGRAVVRAALESPDRPAELVAAVRSARAASEVPPIPEGRGRTALIAYDDPASLRAAFDGAPALVHLPGVLIERRGSSYETANVETTRAAALAARAAGVKKLVLVSAFGADPNSPNRFFRSKGQAEQVVRESGLAWTVLRAPLVLGPDTEGGRALARETSGASAWLVGGGGVLHQPLDAADLAAAVLRTALQPDRARDAALDLVGPTRLSYRELVERAAGLRGHTVRIHSVPAAPLRLLLALRTRLLGPGFSPDALEVLLTDTCADAAATAEALGIHLTPIDGTIRRSLALLENA